MIPFVSNKYIFFSYFYCSDLNSLTEDELWQSYDEHYDVISNLFLSYLKQTDATVQRAGDYNHFDVLSLLTTDQFSIMLDILFDKLVKIGEFGEINVSFGVLFSILILSNLKIDFDFNFSMIPFFWN